MATTTTDEPEQEAPQAEPAQPPAVIDRDEQVAERQRQEIDAAAEAALAMPGMASRDEFLALAMQAKLLSMSGAAPKAIRGNPHVALHIAMIGRDLGISPSAAVELIDVIETSQGPRPSLSPQLMNGQLRRLGLGSIKPAARSNRGCYAVAVEPHGRLDYRCARSWPAHVADDDPQGPCRCEGIIGDSRFTWEDAQVAGLIDKRCPDASSHWVKQGTQGKDRDNRCDCAFGYKTYPDRMFWWRSSGFAADDFFPEAGMGLYQAEALGAVVDVDGRAIDPATVELPDGYEQQGRGGGGASDGATAAPDVVWALQLRVHALPEDAQAEYKKRWMQAKVPGRLTEFPAAKEKLVESLLRGVEHQWKAQGLYDPDAGPAEFQANVLGAAVAAVASMPPGTAARDRTPDAPDEAPQDAPSAPETPAATDTAPEPLNAAGGDEAPNGGVPGALPLDVPEPDAAGDTEALLSIPDEVRTASDDDKAEWAVAYVKAMRIGEVDEVLRRKYQRETKGGPNDRRARLVFQILEHELGIEGAEAAADG